MCYNRNIRGDEMNNNLIIVANIVAKEGKAEYLKSELLKLIEITRAEAGCVQYTLQQNNEEPNKFVFYEQWENRDLWQIHMNNSHLAQYMANTEKEDAVESFIVQEMTVIE